MILLWEFKPQKPPPLPSSRTICPEHTAGFFSRLSFSWMTPIMTVGYKRKLETEDLWLVNPDRSIKSMGSGFEEAFRTRITAGAKHPLALALHDTFKLEFWLGGICVLVANICIVCVPIVLRYLLRFIADSYLDKGEQGVGRGIGLVLTIVILQVIQSVGTNQFIYRGFTTGVQARAVLSAAIFEKSLKLSASARLLGAKGSSPKNEKKKQNGDKGNASTGYNNGAIMSIMSSDTQRIDQAAGMFHLIWTSPIAILSAFGVLASNLGYSAVVGFSLLFFGIPGLTLAVRSLLRRRKSINKTTEERVSLMQEVLYSIRFLKYNAWEAPFLTRLNKLRKQEFAATTKLLTTRNAINSVSVSLPILAAMLSFIVYSYSGNALDAASMFSSLALFNALRVPFNLLPLVIGQLADAWSALKRIQDFLVAEEHRETIELLPANSYTPFSDLDSMDGTNEAAIQVSDVEFVWEHDTTKANSEQDVFSISSLNFSVAHGELLAVVGAVGSGKTSLLSGLAGQMRQTRGRVAMVSESEGPASRALCPQQAWIQNTTLRGNILFGSPFDASWYQEVVDACCLGPDIDNLSAGDLTEIGERGVNLSGGQQQRINLARAIYANRDVILMDDPLSAVDAHVGRHMFEHAICGVLKNKTRILSSHNLDVLRRCDRVLWLEDGRISGLGTFGDLIAHNSGFQNLMKSSNIMQHSDKASQDEQPDSVAGPRSTGNNKTTESGLLIKNDEIPDGDVPWRVYKSYFSSSGSALFAFIPLVLLVLAQSSNTLTSVWLSWWIQDTRGLDRETYVAIYVFFAVIQTLLSFLFAAGVSVLGSRASRRLLEAATTRIVKAPLDFHASQPMGRMMTRFSRDVEVMDNQLPDALRMFSYTVAVITSIFTLIIVYFHYFGIALVPLSIAFFCWTIYYRASARQFKRHESVFRAALFARFGEALSGVQTIRAYGEQARFTDTIHRAIDEANAAGFLTLSNQRWLTARLDLVAIGVVLTTGLLVVLMHKQADPGNSGVVLSYVLSTTQMVQLVVRQLAEVDSAMNSTERLHEYATELPMEDVSVGEKHNHLDDETRQSPKSWVTHGAIRMENLHMRYRPDLPFVLRGLNLRIKSGEKLAVVGRTGAGKTSITAALFRLVPDGLAAGRIEIDGTDISTVPLSSHRASLSVIPQDPTLFKGTIRSNLDPFGNKTDMQLWSALRQVGMKGTSRPPTGTEKSGYPEPEAIDLQFMASRMQKAQNPRTQNAALNKVSLDSVVEEQGANFSQGQRQLLALARVLVQDSKIVVFDEATSSIDMETEIFIQNAMKRNLRDKTVIAIAHRLRTILDYDRVLVLDRGMMLECDSPYNLWKRRGTQFRSMCDKSGIQAVDFKQDSKGDNRRSSWLIEVSQIMAQIRG